MGFLSNLLTKEAKKIITGVVDNVVDDVLDNIRDRQPQSSDSVTPKSVQSVKSNISSDGEDFSEAWAENESDIRRSIESIAAEEWSAYELRRDIPASELGAEPGARDFTYGLYLNGVPKAMIIILPKPHQYGNLDTCRAHAACSKQGVFCMNLLPHLPNRRSYIAAKLRKNVAR